MCFYYYSECTINHESHGKCYTEGKCPLHPDSSRSNHLQTGEHPCNCCYCTVFGQVVSLFHYSIDS